MIPFGVAAILLLGVLSPFASAQPVQAVYLVALEGGVGTSEFAAAHGFSVVFEYHHAFNGLAVVANPFQAATLSYDSRILAVQRDGPVQIASQTLPTGVDRIESDRNNLSKIDGTDERVPVTVAIVDTGIQLDHPDLNVNQNYMKNCMGEGPPLDGHGHGTHVSGTVGALDNGIGVVGVAPGADLIAVKVLDDAGFGSYATIACGLDWIAGNSALIDVVSMSLGGGGSDDGNCGRTSGDVLHTAICGVVAKGVVIVAAAGNSAVDAKYFVPAAYDEVITVSAVADSDGRPGAAGPTTCRTKPDDAFASFSNFGADVDIAGPGECILSTYKNGTYETLSGTSMATPHVSAMAAEYILSRGKPIDQAGTVDVKNGLIFLGFAQTGSYGFTGDPDAFHERLSNGWNYTFSGPAPPPPLETDFTFSPADPRTGEQVTFSPVSVGGTPPYSYTWAFGDGATGTGDPGSHAYTTTGTFNAVLTVGDSASQTASITRSVVVTTPTPLIADFTHSPEHKTPGSVSFFAFVSGGIRPYSYTWNFGDGTPTYETTSSSVAHTFTEGAYTVNLTVTDSKAPPNRVTSSHSIVVVSRSSIEVHVAISATFSSRGAFLNPRVDDSIKMSSAVARGSPPYTFLWNFGDGATSTQSSAMHVYGAAGTYVISLTATDGQGGSETVSRSMTVESPASPQPLEADWTFSSMEPAVAEVVAFSAAVSAGITPYDLTWDFGDGTPNVLGTLTTTHAYATAGYYFPTFGVVDGGLNSISIGKTLVVSGSPPPPPSPKANTTTTIEVHDPSHANVTAGSVPLEVAIHGSAMVSIEGVGPPITGFVTYRWFATGDCAGLVMNEVVVTVGEESPATTLGAGSHSVKAYYSGDPNYSPSVSLCELFSVRKGVTTIAIAIHDPSHTSVTSVPLGTAVHGNATASGAVSGFPITGNVQLSLFRNATCSGALVSENVASGAESTPQTLGVGVYGYVATYGGDANYLSSTSDCEPFTVRKAETATTLRIHSSSHAVVESIAPGSKVHGQPIVSGRVGDYEITGSVEFRLFTTGACTDPFVAQTVPVGSESGSSDPLIAGDYTFTALYLGDQNYSPSASSCILLNVTSSPPLPSTTHLLLAAVVFSSIIIVALSLKNRRLRRIAAGRIHR